VASSSASVVRPEWVLRIFLELHGFLRSLPGDELDVRRFDQFFTSLPPPKYDLEHRILSDLREKLALLLGAVDCQTRAERARQLLIDEYRKPWTLARLARATGSNRTTLQEEFRILTGMTIHRYLVRRRVSMAAHLLERSDIKASRVSMEVGYRSHGAFSRHFKEITGETPGRYRASRRYS
jgi:AraC-like DNA-binding protein